MKYVKTRHSYVIEKPLVLPRTATIAEVSRLIERHRSSGILIEETAGSGLLAGLLSQRDLPHGPDGSDERLVEELMTPVARLVTRPPTVSMEEAEKAMWERRVEKLPLVDEAGRIRGLVTMRDLHLFKKKPWSVKDERGRLRVGAAIGAAGDYLERAAALADAEVDVILMDVAHAHSEILAKAVPAFRSRFPNIPLVVGNVATGEGARFLADLGAAAIKVGVGPGRGCRTRLETGRGRAAAPGDPRGVPRDGGEGPDHRGRRHPERQGRLPRPRLRRLHRHARFAPLGHGRVARASSSTTRRRGRR